MLQTSEDELKDSRQQAAVLNGRQLALLERIMTLESKLETAHRSLGEMDALKAFSDQQATSLASLQRDKMELVSSVGRRAEDRGRRGCALQRCREGCAIRGVR
jgi:hypothetical protein